MKERGSLRQNILLGLSFLLMVGALYLIFIWVPTEETMGIVQRVFYFHVPLAWIGFLAFFIVFLGSVLYLWKREERWDTLAYSSGEIGVMMTTLVLITGPIWARPVWGTWWTWDARLTTTLVLWLIYLAYLMVRAYAAQSAQGATFAAVVGIVGFFDVPIVFMAIRWWRTQHPEPVFETGGLHPTMLVTLLVSLAAFTLLYIVLLRQNASLKQAEKEMEELRQSQTGG